MKADTLQKKRVKAKFKVVIYGQPKDHTRGSRHELFNNISLQKGTLNHNFFDERCL
jgi:hypothetical protein